MRGLIRKRPIGKKTFSKTLERQAGERRRKRSILEIYLMPKTEKTFKKYKRQLLCP